MMAVLVTGGAGYIGAHIARQLVRDGREVVVLDDLSTGALSRVSDLPLARVDLTASEAVAQARAFMSRHAVDSVIHLAAKKSVPESIQRPEWYYAQNAGGLLNLLEAMRDVGVDVLVFSSSAAVYGDTTATTVAENSDLRPVNPYGRTKLIGEWLTHDAAVSRGIRTTVLRYFNVAGAGAPELADTSVANLTTLVLDRISRGQAPVIFGDDYATTDGTCIRDFVHVEDLARAHLRALDGLAHTAPGTWSAYNVGTGKGVSVRQMVEHILSASGAPSVVTVDRRRPGDPAAVVGDVSRIEAELGWTATRSVTDMVESAIEAWRHLSTVSDRHLPLP